MSVDFPTTLGVVQSVFGPANRQSFVSRFNESEMTSLPATTTRITSSASSVEYGKPVTFTVTVHQSTGSVPTGPIALNYVENEDVYSNGPVVGPGPWTLATLDSSGNAKFTTSALVPGFGFVYAHYLGDAHNAPSDGNFTQTVTPIPITITLKSSANPAVYGTPVAFTASVVDDGSRPVTGAVEFTAAATSDVVVVLSGKGQAVWVNGTGGPPLPVGASTVNAKYLPDEGFGNSSTSLTQTFTSLGATPAPTFSPPAGTYDSTQYVTLTDSNSAANIYYTTDGSSPVARATDQYLQGSRVEVSSSETIRAMAVAPGYTSSTTASANYSIDLPPPDFSISAGPVNLFLSAGQSTTTTVKIGALNGFAQAVSLQCSGLPAGVTCSFAPVSVSPGSASTLTLSDQSNIATSSLREQLSFVSIFTLLMVSGSWRAKRWPSRFLILLTFALLPITLSGCGGGSGGGGGSGTAVNPPSQTFQITVEGTSGGLSHSQQLSLTVN
jgi:hypothetical protein